MPRFPWPAAAAALLALGAAQAAERAPEGAGVSLDGRPACVDGEKPTEPYSQHDKWGMERYDAELQRYKRDHERYLRCAGRRGSQGAAGADSLEHKVDEAIRNPQQY